MATRSQSLDGFGQRAHDTVNLRVPRVGNDCDFQIYTATPGIAGACSGMESGAFLLIVLLAFCQFSNSSRPS